MTQRVLIVGGGISGLATAFYLNRFADEENLSLDIQLIEKNERLGGCLGTYLSQGCLMEEGAESFITLKSGALDLSKELNIEDELIETNQEERQSYIYSQGKLRPTPEGFYLFAPSKIRSFLFSSILSWKGKLRVLAEFFIPSESESLNESIGDFVERRFGKECCERLAQPMIGGIYGGNIYKLSLQSTFPHLLEMENKDGGVIRGLLRKRRLDEAESQASGPRYSLFLSFKAGMGTLISSLVNALNNKITYVEKKALKLHREGSQYQLTLENNEILKAAGVCLALTANAAAEVVFSLDESFHQRLIQIKYESSVTINFLFSLEGFEKPSGFGFVVPEAEGSPILGCTFSSNKFSHRSPSGTFLIRCFLATSRNQEILSHTDAELSQIALQEIYRMTKIKGQPLMSYVKKYSKVLPQYELEHENKIKLIRQKEKEYAGLYLTGNYFFGTGVPDCISQAKETAKRMIQYLAKQ